MTALRPSGRVLIYAVLLFFAAYYLMPIYMLLLSSFKPFDQVSVNQMWDLPTGLYLNTIIKI
jgi:glucose/mannose transport system permease protein